MLTGSDVVGDVPSEVAWLVRCGLAPEDALAAATTAARTYLGLPPLTAGNSADLVTYAQDPATTPRCCGPRRPCSAPAAEWCDEPSPSISSRTAHGADGR